MHGRAVNLVAGKHAIYDISWDNAAMDTAGPAHLARCLVIAYVWNRNAGTFDYDKKFTNEATRDYCQALEQEVH